MQFPSNPGSVNPNEYALPPEVKAALDAANRKRQIAQLLVQQGGQPQGGMVGSHYVAPHWTQRLSGGLSSMLGAKTMMDADSEYRDQIGNFSAEDQKRSAKLTEEFLNPQPGTDVGRQIAEAMNSKYPQTAKTAERLWNKSTESFKAAAPHMSAESVALLHSRAGLPPPDQQTFNVPSSPLLNGDQPQPQPQQPAPLGRRPEEISHLNDQDIMALEKEISMAKNPETVDILKNELATVMAEKKRGTHFGSMRLGMDGTQLAGNPTGGIASSGAQKIYGPGDSMPGPKKQSVNGVVINKNSDPWLFSPDGGTTKIPYYTDEKGKPQPMPNTDEFAKGQNQAGIGLTSDLVKDGAKVIRETRTPLQQSLNKLPVMMNAAELIKEQNYTSGSLANFRTEAAHIIQTLTGKVVDPKIASTEQLRADLYEAFTANLKQLGTTQLSNVDVAAALEASPGITKDPRAAYSLMMKAIMGVGQAASAYENQRGELIGLGQKIPGSPDLNDQFKLLHNYKLPESWTKSGLAETWQKVLAGEGYDPNVFNAANLPIVVKPGQDPTNAGIQTDARGAPVKGRRRVFKQSEGFVEQIERDLGNQ